MSKSLPNTQNKRRAPAHDAAVHFRAASCVVLAAENRARAQGMSLSEYLRHVIRKDAMENVA